MKKFVRETKNALIYDDIEIIVREATSNEPCLPSLYQKKMIAKISKNKSDYDLMFRMLWKRLTDVEVFWHVLKALELVHYLMEHGSAAFVKDCIHRHKAVGRLKKYKHYEDGVEVGGKVRRKAEVVHQLILDAYVHRKRQGRLIISEKPKDKKESIEKTQTSSTSKKEKKSRKKSTESSVKKNRKKSVEESVEKSSKKSVEKSVKKPAKKTTKKTTKKSVKETKKVKKVVKNESTGDEFADFADFNDTSFSNISSPVSQPAAPTNDAWGFTHEPKIINPRMSQPEMDLLSGEGIFGGSTDVADEPLFDILAPVKEAAPVKHVADQPVATPFDEKIGGHKDIWELVDDMVNINDLSSPKSKKPAVTSKSTGRRKSEKATLNSMKQGDMGMPSDIFGAPAPVPGGYPMGAPMGGAPGGYPMGGPPGGFPMGAAAGGFPPVQGMGGFQSGGFPSMAGPAPRGPAMGNSAVNPFDAPKKQTGDFNDLLW